MHHTLHVTVVIQSVNPDFLEELSLAATSKFTIYLTLCYFYKMN